MLDVDDAYRLDIDRLMHPDVDRSDQAFERLMQRSSKFLLGHFRRKGAGEQEAEDLVQMTFGRLWASRRDFTIRSRKEWWGLVLKVGHRAHVDLLRQNGLRVSATSLSSMTDGEVPSVEPLLDHMEDRNAIVQLADRFWLGEMVDEKNAFAAVMHFRHGMGIDELSRLMPVAGQGQLDAFLSHESAIRTFAFHELYVGNDALASHVLDRTGPGKQSEWHESEVPAIVLRLRNGLTTEQILRFKGCELDQGQLERLFKRARERYPFGHVAQSLAARFAGRSASIFREASLWRRLVFQYHLIDELPQRQILERVQPAATIFGVEMSESLLAGWISRGRLWAQLATFASKELSE